MGTVTLVGWQANPAKQDQYDHTQCQWSVQHLFGALKQLTHGDGTDEPKFKDLERREKQRRSRLFEMKFRILTLQRFLFITIYNIVMLMYIYIYYIYGWYDDLMVERLRVIYCT